MRIVSPAVAVIDVGSNSIKALVATRNEFGQIEAIAQRTLDSRISTGISQVESKLSAEGMTIGEEAVADLFDFVSAHHPREIRLVATSAVRDASNGAEFKKRIAQRLNLPLQILDGEQEARLIGQGLLCDPELSECRDFQVFDLGGGSLECLSFTDRELTHAKSLPLGCVRLTEKFVQNIESPLDPRAASAVLDYVTDRLSSAEFPFAAPGRHAVFSGGTITTCRTILAAAKNIPLAETSPRVTIELIAAILKKLSSLPLAQRREVAGLPARRADVMPVALVTVLALATLGNFTAFQHSFYNLRWGVAAELLR